MKSITTMNIKINDGKKTIPLELYISDDTNEFYKNSILPGVNISLKGKILYESNYSLIKFIHDEIEIYDL